jgi:2-oxoglutarate/2-oxoacid ferredoxin oxidoreductase subunit alpha
MRLQILIGGKAGQGINKVSGIVTRILTDHGYFIFNYRDYPSIIRGGHNFNIISVSDHPIASHESQLDGIIALDEHTKNVHQDELKENGFVVDYKEFLKFGLNANVALAGALSKILGIEKNQLLKVVQDSMKGKKYLAESLRAAEAGYVHVEKKYTLQKLKQKPIILSGSKAVALGAINSKIDVYCAYPMTPATNTLHELASRQIENNLLAFQAEGEIAAVNMALGASFSGARVMVGTSGGGFDLMSEGLSLQGISELPLVVYLASRVGPGTGIPTYTMQGDLDIALRAGHGEFPRVVIAPGDPFENIESVNEAFYLSQEFNCLSIILSDKHVAESEYSSLEKVHKSLAVKVTRDVPGERVIKATSYEHDEDGITTENAEIAKQNADKRVGRYKDIQKACTAFEMISMHGKKKSKNLIIGWGSTKGAIIDAIDGLDFKFLQVRYMKPLSDQIKIEMEKADNVILVENNLTGQLGRLIREKTGIKIEKKILKYDGRPFLSDELRKELESI